MTAEGTKPAVPDDEYRKQVLARYEARRKSFVQQFSILIVFGLGFLAFILVPLIGFKLDADRVAGDLAAKAATIERLQQDNARILAEQERLQGERDILNGKLTSLQFVRVQKEEEAGAAQEALAKLAGEVEAIEAKTAALKARLKPLRATEARMEKALDRFVPNERAGAFRDWFLNMADRSAQDPACADPNDWQRYYACMVRAKLQADWDEDFAVIRTAVVEPLQATEPAAAQSIEDELVHVRQAFEERLGSNPDFWRTIDQKLVFMEQLSAEWDRAFDAIRAITRARMAEIQKAAGPLEREIVRLGEQRGALTGRLDGLEAERADIAAEQERGFAQAAEFERQQAELEVQAKTAEQALTENQKELAELELRRREIEKQQADIETRIQDFQSPFGKLPLGLKEATLAFPFILTAGFLVYALLLADLIGLRREYHDQARASLPGDPETVRRRVAVMAPLWFDPARLSWRGAGALILFLHPVPIFVAVVWLIASGWLLPLDADRSGRFLTFFYEALYVVGGLLLVIGVWRVAAEWLGYRTAEAKMARAPEGASG